MLPYSSRKAYQSTIQGMRVIHRSRNSNLS